MDSKNCEPNKD